MILICDGEEYQIQGRVATIISWLISREDRVSAPASVQLIFNCSGNRDVSVEIKERERAAPIPSD